MGPPPNAEDMLSMLENPMFASQMNEAMNNPAVIQMMQNNPMSKFSCCTLLTQLADATQSATTR